MEPEGINQYSYRNHHLRGYVDMVYLVLLLLVGDYWYNVPLMRPEKNLHKRHCHY